MSFIAYVLMFIGIVVVLAIGGLICESEALANKMNAVKNTAAVVGQIIVYALMLPAVIVCKAACAFGITDRENA